MLNVAGTINMIFCFIDYVPCGDAPVVENSRSKYEGDESTMMVVKYKCNVGFQFTDGKTSKTIECVVFRGRWNQKLSDCQG